MKVCYFSLICIVARVVSADNAPIFESSFTKFHINNTQITWTAPTNQLCAVLWTYKVVPQVFSEKEISELMHSSLINNKIKEVREPLHYSNSSNTCSLVVIPAQGYIKYFDEFAPPNHWDSTNHLWERVEGLPNKTKIEQLGLKLLKQFGIKRTELAQNKDSHLITFGENKTRSYFDRRTNKYIDDEVIARGIFFNRRIDGVNFAGIGLGGGCEIEFGNNAKIADFKLVWRNLQRYEHYKVATQDEIKQFIFNGSAVLTHKNYVNPANIRQLTITDISPLYMGANGNEIQNFIYPFAKIEAIADVGNTNQEIELYCPILSTNKVTN